MDDINKKNQTIKHVFLTVYFFFMIALSGYELMTMVFLSSRPPGEIPLPKSYDVFTIWIIALILRIVFWAEMRFGFPKKKKFYVLLSLTVVLNIIVLPLIEA